MNTTRLAFLCLLCCLLPGLVMADMLNHRSGLSVWAPDDWVQETDEDLLMLSSPDDTAGVILLVFPEQNSQIFSDAIDQELDKLIQNKRITNESEITINGIPGYAIEGVGSIDNTMSDFVVACLIFDEHMVMILGAAESSRFAEYEDTLVQIITSVQAR